VDSAVGPANRVANIYRSADATTKFGRLALDSGLDPAATRPQEFAWDLINAYRRTHDVELFDAIYDVREAAMDYLRLYPGRWFRRALVDAVNFSAGYSDLVLFIGQERQDRFVRLGYKGLYQNSDYTTLAIFLFARFVVGLLMLSGAGLATIYWLKRRGPGLLLPAVLLAIVLPTALTGLYAPRVRVPYDPFLVCSAVVGWSIGLNWLLGAWRSRTILTSVLTLRPKYHT